MIGIGGAPWPSRARCPAHRGNATRLVRSRTSESLDLVTAAKRRGAYLADVIAVKLLFLLGALLVLGLLGAAIAAAWAVLASHRPRIVGLDKRNVQD
jgi:hypothetical protein